MPISLFDTLPYRSFARRGIRRIKRIVGDEGARYDCLAFDLMRKILQIDDCCFDIGSHKGLYLDEMIRLAPRGTHHAFEPLPALCERLRTAYAANHNVMIHECALANASGQTEFQFNTTNPGWSGIRRRSYPSERDDVQVLSVTMRALDDMFPPKTRVDFAKLDVEGAEYEVIKGGSRVLQENKPVLVFEYGLGSSECYGAGPAMMFDILAEFGFLVEPMERCLDIGKPLTRRDFIDCYQEHKSYYFVAYTEYRATRWRS